MSRRWCFLALVLFFFISEPTYGARLFRHRRVCCRPIICEPRDSPTFCLQQIIWDVPNSSVDFYECLTYPDDCGPDEEVEHWADYVFAPFEDPDDLPQDCDGPDYCLGQRLSPSVVPGYYSILRVALDTQDVAKRVLSEHFVDEIPQGSLAIDFIKIPKSKVTRIFNGDLYVVVARHPRPTGGPEPGPSPAGVPYFGLQMENTGEAPTHVLTNANCQHATASDDGKKQIRIAFEIGGEDRVAVIWLK